MPLRINAYLQLKHSAFDMSHETAGMYTVLVCDQHTLISMLLDMSL